VGPVGRQRHICLTIGHPGQLRPTDGQPKRRSLNQSEKSPKNGGGAGNRTQRLGAAILPKNKGDSHFPTLVEPSGTPALSRSIPVDADADRHSRDNGTRLVLEAVAAALESDNVALARRLIAALLDDGK
jgi:hypothetical protein